MTLCALDTRNDSKRNSNAVIIVLLQFNYFFSSHFTLLLVLHAVQVIFSGLMGEVGHHTKIY